MNQEDYSEIARLPESATETITAVSGTDRTLLYGYTCDHKTHHLYQKDGTLHLLVYTETLHERSDISHKEGEIPLSDLVPDKRLYPEACDAEFSNRLRLRNINLPFLAWDQERTDKREAHRGSNPFYGFVLD